MATFRVLQRLLVLAATVEADLGQHSPQVLQDSIGSAIMPILQNYSSTYNDSAWAFAYRDAHIRFAICAGYSDREAKIPCTPQDQFNWGSTTKPQTAVLVLQLAERGLLRLDDSIVPHIDPYLARTFNNLTSLVDLWGPQVHNVTVRHLLQHTSGIIEYDDGKSTIYQNSDEHRLDDLSPEWILNYANHTFLGPPGTVHKYSSTGYVLLGLIIASKVGAPSWDRLDQRVWIHPGSREFQNMRYPVHGPCSRFTTADGSVGASIHGYQKSKKLPSNESDIFNMSCTQGWTCGNLNSPPEEVADFFWTLLGPPRHDPQRALLNERSFEEMMSFEMGEYLGDSGSFGYGLGLMNFTSMNWGFEFEGPLYGHNGLTYGFGAQSGYHSDLEFSATWVTNTQHWIGPQDRKGPNALYEALIGVVRKFREQEALEIHV